MIDPKLLSDIQQAEGLSLTAYLDTLGNWTIGYGHELPPGNWSGETVTQNQANDYLTADLTEAQQGAQTLPEWPAVNTPCRQNAIYELVFNMGLIRWCGFIKCRNNIQQQNWQGASNQLLNSLWAGQVGPTRSTRLANYLLTGNYG